MSSDPSAERSRSGQAAADDAPTGERLLVLSIIERAVADAISTGHTRRGDRAEARAYFADGRYARHLGLLDLPGDGDRLPAAIQTAGAGGHGPGCNAALRNHDELAYWLACDDAEAQVWRESAPAREWAAMLAAYWAGGGGRWQEVRTIHKANESEGMSEGT